MTIIIYRENLCLAITVATFHQPTSCLLYILKVVSGRDRQFFIIVKFSTEYRRWLSTGRKISHVIVLMGKHWFVLCKENLSSFFCKWAYVVFHAYILSKKLFLLSFFLNLSFFFKNAIYIFHHYSIKWDFDTSIYKLHFYNMSVENRWSCHCQTVGWLVGSVIIRRQNCSVSRFR